MAVKIIFVGWILMTELPKISWKFNFADKLSTLVNTSIFLSKY